MTSAASPSTFSSALAEISIPEASQSSAESQLLTGIVSGMSALDAAAAFS